MSREWDDDGPDEYFKFALWENSLVNALNGARGQAFLRELEAELLAMQARGEGRLLEGYLIADGKPDRFGCSTPTGVCTLGVMLKKKVASEKLQRWINHECEGPYEGGCFAKDLNIAKCLIAEIGTTNDNTNQWECREHWAGHHQKIETDEERFERMLKWVRAHISKSGEKVQR